MAARSTSPGSRGHRAGAMALKTALLVAGVAACPGNGTDGDGSAPGDARIDTVATRDAAADLARDTRATPDLCSGPLVDLGPDPGPTHLTSLTSSADHDRVEGLTRCAKNVRYLIRVDGREPPEPLKDTCLFQNTRRFEYHLLFLRHFPELADMDLERYLDLAVREDTQVWWAGGLYRRDAAVHPGTGQTGVVAYAVYRNEDATPLTVAELVQIDRRLKGCIPYAADRLVLTPGSPTQRPHFSALATKLAEQGVHVVLSL